MEDKVKKLLFKRNTGMNRLDAASINSIIKNQDKMSRHMTTNFPNLPEALKRFKLDNESVNKKEQQTKGEKREDQSKR